MNVMRIPIPLWNGKWLKPQLLYEAGKFCSYSLHRLCLCYDQQPNWQILSPAPDSPRDLNNIIEFQCEETLKHKASLLWGNEALVHQF